MPTLVPPSRCGPAFPTTGPNCVFLSLASATGAPLPSFPSGFRFGHLAAVGRKLIRHSSLFEFFWILFWIFAEIVVVYSLLRMFFGRDAIIVGGGAFSIRKELVGFARTRTYLVSEMRDLRFQPELGAGKGRSASRIAFDYGAKTFAFAEEIDLIRLINARAKIPAATSIEPGIRFWQHD